MKTRNRSTINPYFTAANMILLAPKIILNRLKWDLKPESWRSRRKLKKLTNQYEGQKAVILCNGPSLLKTDFSLLKGTFTFGLNKINLLFNQSDFRPSCIVAVNSFVLKQNAIFYNKTDIELFLSAIGVNCIKSRPNVIFINTWGGPPGFARDCSITLHEGSTVTYVAMQIAFHMGFHDVALIGCDHNYFTNGPPHEIVVSAKKDPNHFDSKYFADGAKWQLPDLSTSELSYIQAYKVYKNAGRRIVNATIGGKLEILPRISIEEFLERT